MGGCTVSEITRFPSCIFAESLKAAFVHQCPVSAALTTKSTDALHAYHKLAYSSGEAVSFHMLWLYMDLRQFCVEAYLSSTQKNAALAVISLSGDSLGAQEALRNE